MTAPETPPADWITRAPRSLTDLVCLQGHVITENQDRRWLHRLVQHLDIPGQRQLQIDLGRYLADTCAHHWHDVTGWHCTEPTKQCLWCHRVEDGAATP